MHGFLLREKKMVYQPERLNDSHPQIMSCANLTKESHPCNSLNKLNSLKRSPSLTTPAKIYRRDISLNQKVRILNGTIACIYSFT